MNNEDVNLKKRFDEFACFIPLFIISLKKPFVFLEEDLSHNLSLSGTTETQFYLAVEAVHKSYPDSVSTSFKFLPGAAYQSPPVNSSGQG